MQNDFNSGYQYNRCVSRGICSINPATSSLQEVIITYLKIAAFYGLKLEEADIHDKKVTNLILNTISIISSNYEISEANFNIINLAFREELPRIIEEYEIVCKEKDIEPEWLSYDIMNVEQNNISDYIRYGEKEFLKRIKGFSAELRTLYKILFILVKSICVNILTAESYNEDSRDEILFVLKILNTLNTSKQGKQELKKLITEASELDCKLIKKINELQNKYYGEQSEQEVSFSTRKGNAVLVVGSNIRELEQVLDKFSGTNVDVYTHDNMIIAHTFPKFKEYKNLKGQFGQGMENCLLDFSTFPGPIILTRHSLYNAENLYRGRLYTTDFAYLKGVIPIRDNDFSSVIKAADESKGFKTGKKCASEKAGILYNAIFEKIETKIQTEKYTDIIVSGIHGYSSEEQEYFKTFFKHVPENILIITFSCYKEKDNLISLSPYNDISALSKISDYIINTQKRHLNLIMPFCDRHSLSVLIKFGENALCDTFIGPWDQTILNPIVTEGLSKNFNIHKLTTPKNDLVNLFKE